MTKKELARAIYRGVYPGDDWKESEPAFWYAAADAAFAALGVTPDPELPPGPWHVITGAALKIGTPDEPHGRWLAPGTRTELWLRAAVAAWNKANGY